MVKNKHHGIRAIETFSLELTSLMELGGVTFSSMEVISTVVMEAMCCITKGDNVDDEAVEVDSMCDPMVSLGSCPRLKYSCSPTVAHSKIRACV